MCLNLLRRRKPNKSPGPDNIHPRLLKELADVLALPISLLFQKSLESKQLPQDWKSANVTPIFKKGNKGDSKNYRPVSLTSIICKMMENLVRKQLLDNLMMNDLILVHQHGFVVGRSCITNLLEVLDQWTQILDDGGTVDAIYLDFMKAFDTLPHHRLLLKLESYGVRGNVLAWLESFLSGRQQRVVVRSKQSKWGKILSGVPQGSVLGLCLFLLFVNDLPKVVNSNISMFADDTKL